MEELLGLAPAAVGGGVFGLVGSLLGRGLGIFEAKQRRLEKAQDHAHEIALLDKQREIKQAETENEIALEDAKGKWGGLSESIRAEAANVSYKWVAATKSMVRVVMTPTLWFLVGWIVYLLKNGDLAAYMDAGEASALIAYVVKSIIFTATTATAWWFGDRAPTRPSDRHPTS